MLIRNNSARFAGTVIFFLLLLSVAGNASACDMSAFVQGDFAARCQLLLDLCEKATIAQRVAHPDSQKHNGNLSREWVRFFLAHGSAATRPPSLGFIASATWETGVKNLGFSIAELTRGEISAEAYEILRLKIDLIKNPAKIEETRQVFYQTGASQADHENVSKEKSLKWLEQNFLGPGSVIADKLSKSPLLLNRLESSAATFLETAGRIDSINGSESAGLAAAISEGLQNSVSEELHFWQQLFFCDSVAAANADSANQTVR
ncbi:MAG TPA: hypothetical protein PKN29_03330 [Candidatus Ozemobacteraceae bacterium]|nr:hypothetical protein [Candidatus Ozemobacteraceae bacterium]